MAVTKGFGPEAIEAAVAAGCADVGESYAQELVAKLPEVRGPAPVVHFIGHLQTNKVKQLAPVVDVWQSVDRLGAVEAWPVTPRRRDGARPGERGGHAAAGRLRAVRGSGVWWTPPRRPG